MRKAILILGCILYVISPIDILPDFIPGGQLDDLAAIVLTVRSLFSKKETKVGD
jgi:uncharacterized membrane protein YkvA (DUF1232 family)